MEALARTVEETCAADPGAIEDWIREHIAQLVGVTAARVSVHKPIATFGVDSAEAAALAEELEQWLGATIPLDLIWEWASAREIAGRVAEHFAMESF